MTRLDLATMEQDLPVFVYNDFEGKLYVRNRLKFSTLAMMY
jgi:hypothetical protein